jgi:hypothetical protein
MREWDALVHDVLHRHADRDTVFPWDRLDIGVSRKFLYSEWVKYRRGLVTSPCPEDGCGACRLCGMDEFLSLPDGS